MSAPQLSYSLKQAAEATGLSQSHLDREIKEGRLRARTTKLSVDDKPIGKRVIFARDLEAYLEGLAEV